MKDIIANQIDSILPQTQCGLCGYNGCMPYAKALSNNDSEINLCPPGGIEGLKKIAKILKKDPSNYITDMQEKTKPQIRAVIREDECIGCTKCINACPVDAILGTAKNMHIILTDECTGCELCIAPCPVDCIDIIPSNDTNDRRGQYKARYQAREIRLQKNETKNRKKTD
ncbi:RnfABCDGE type electron transport complex subunit B, partial [Gammaproteobacteria bacterium]|nr:RnfABCDGE type electron transport complex subunit B [Gammaproteobacteria bacterium]